MAVDNINTRFDNKLSNFELKCEKLLTVSNSTFKNHVQSLEQQLIRENEMINQLFETIRNMTSKQDSPNTSYINRNSIQKSDKQNYSEYHNQH